MATSKIPFNDGGYYDEHFVRAVGVALSSTQIAVPIQVINPNNKTPTISSIYGAAISGVGNVTASVDTTRTSGAAITFLFVGTGFTTGRAYLCQLGFTLS